jgi:hypothetical protein
MRTPTRSTIDSAGYFWRSNNIPAFNRNGDGSITMRRMPKHALKGVPDITVIKPPYGLFVGLEEKRPEGRLSPEQKEFEAACPARGAQYHIVHSTEEVQALGL